MEYIKLIELFPFCSDSEIREGLTFHSENIDRLYCVLNQIRNDFGRPIRVNSGYRDYKHNKRVGGVKSSEHMDGIAADICCTSTDLTDFMCLIDSVCNNSVFLGQVIVYNTFIHVALKSDKYPDFKLSYYEKRNN